MKSTTLMRNRARELATPPRDDFDRAVLAVLDDLDAMRGTLVRLREPVCSLACPSVWRTGEKPPHDPLCESITAALRDGTYLGEVLGDAINGKFD